MSERSFVLIGQTDSGKSTTGSRIIVTSGSIDENEIFKAKNAANENNKGSFWLAYLLDIDEMERKRGITLGYTTYDFKYKDTDLKLIDVPGHQILVKEMILGASYANIAVLILSASKGEYESSLKGQTIEHTIICRALGISTLIVAINKIDESTEEEIERIKNDFSARIKKFRFKKIEFVPISAINGTNVDKLLDTIISIPFEIPIHKEIALSEDKCINTKFMFDDIPNLITSGFKCICHSKDSYFNVEFIEIKNDKFNFVTHKNSIDKNGAGKMIDVKLKILDDIKTITQNLVIRYQNQTIGLARVI